MSLTCHSEIARFRAAFEALPDGTRPEIEPEMLDSILDAAGRLSDEVLAPLDATADRQGCRVENGRVVMDGDAADLRENEDVKEFYLGIAGDDQRSFRNVKAYKRRKRWLA